MDVAVRLVEQLQQQLQQQRQDRLDLDALERSTLHRQREAMEAQHEQHRRATADMLELVAAASARSGTDGGVGGEAAAAMTGVKAGCTLDVEASDAIDNVRRLQRQMGKQAESFYIGDDPESKQSELDKPRAACPGPAGLVPLPSERWVTPNSHAEGRGPEKFSEKFMECEGFTGDGGLGGASAEPLCDSEFAGSLSPRTSGFVEDKGVNLAASWTLAAGASDEAVVTVCGGRKLGATMQCAEVLAGLSSDKWGGSDGGLSAADGGVGEEAQHQGSIGLRGASVEPLCDSGEFAGSLHPRASDFVVGGVMAAGNTADAATGVEVTVCGGRRLIGATMQYADVPAGPSSNKCGGSEGGRSAAEGGVGEKAQHQGSIGLGGASAEPLRDSGEFAGSSSPRASEFVVGGVRAAGTKADAATGEEATVCGGRRLTGATKHYEDVLAGLSNGKWGGSHGGRTAADSGVGEEAQHQGIGHGGASAEPLCDSGEFAGSSSPRASEYVVDGDMAAGSTVDAATHEEVAVCGGRRSSVLTGVRGGSRGGGRGGVGETTALSEAPCLLAARLRGPQVECEVQQLLQAVDESFMANGLFMADGFTMQPELANLLGRIGQLTEPAMVDVEASNTIDTVAVKKRAGRRAPRQQLRK